MPLDLCLNPCNGLLQNDPEQALLIEAPWVGMNWLSLANHRFETGEILSERLKTPIGVDVIHNDRATGS